MARSALFAILLVAFILTIVAFTPTPAVAKKDSIAEAFATHPEGIAEDYCPLPTEATSNITTREIAPAPAIAAAPFFTQSATFLPLIQNHANLVGQLCPTAIHDSYKVQAPDGNWYPTWHPSVDPATGCYFDHEHGDDPRTSLANAELPPFGYINAVANEDHTNHEPHNGFKVFVINIGDTNDEGRTATTSTRMVAHMGTGGVGRYDRRFHSFAFDLIAPDGHEVHVQGMADTGLVGSICERDISLSDNDPSNDIGRAVVTLPGTGCDVGSLYEIWLFKLAIGERALVHGSTAAFDPITIMNRADHAQLNYTADYFDEGYGTDFHGCAREAYHGPVYWYNQDGVETYYTDAYGQIVADGELEQRISRHNAIGIPMNQDQSQMKYISNSCVPGLGLSN